MYFKTQTPPANQTLAINAASTTLANAILAKKGANRASFNDLKERTLNNLMGALRLFNCAPTTHDEEVNMFRDITREVAQIVASANPDILPHREKVGGSVFQIEGGRVKINLFGEFILVNLPQTA